MLKSQVLCQIKMIQRYLLTGPTHADLLQVFILDVVEVRQPRDVQVVPDPQEVLLQLHLHQQLQQPFCAFLALHATAQFLQNREHRNKSLKYLSSIQRFS